MKHAFRFLALVFLVAACVIGYQAYRQNSTVQGLREALDETNQKYDVLATEYNEVVKQTAVTELIALEDQLLVVIKTSFGDVETFATPYDPRREIYVDCVIIDGRLWVRRIFDDLTPPGNAMIIESRFGVIDWNTQAAQDVGKAVYRGLSPGRWAVTITGNGALGLDKVDSNTEIELVDPPHVVRKYQAIQTSID